MTVGSVGSSQAAPALPANADLAYWFFRQQGWGASAAEGIVGNLIAESGVNPESVQAGGPGRGIAQWSVGGRWKPSLMTGNPGADLTAQLGYVEQELTGSYASVGRQLAQPGLSASQASAIVGYGYESYAGATPAGTTASGPTRAAYAQELAAAEQGTSGPGQATLTGKSWIPSPAQLLPGIITGGLAPGAGAVSSLPGVSGIVSGVEGWGLRLVLGLVGAVLVILALYVAGRQSDTGEAIEHDAGETARAGAVGAAA